MEVAPVRTMLELIASIAHTAQPAGMKTVAPPPGIATFSIPAMAVANAGR